jgi:hypothetical protein
MDPSFEISSTNSGSESGLSDDSRGRRSYRHSSTLPCQNGWDSPRRKRDGSPHRHFALAFPRLPSFGLPAAARQLHARPHPAAMFRICCLSYTPGVLQWWLSQPHQQTRRRRCPRPWQVQLSQPERPLPCSCVSTLESSTSLASVSSFTTALASPRAPGKTGALASADHAPPPFSKFRLCT